MCLDLSEWPQFLKIILFNVISYQKATLEEQLAGLNQLISPETAKQVEQLTRAIASLQTQIESLQAGLQ